MFSTIGYIGHMQGRVCRRRPRTKSIAQATTVRWLTAASAVFVLLACVPCHAANGDRIVPLSQVDRIDDRLEIRPLARTPQERTSEIERLKVEVMTREQKDGRPEASAADRQEQAEATRKKKRVAAGR